MIINTAFYFASLFPLSILMLLKIIDFEKPLDILKNYAFCACFLITALCFIYYALVMYIGANVNLQKPTTFSHIKKQEANFFIPITMYFIPFVSVNFASINDFLVLIFIVALMGAILIKTNLQYLNPLIAIVGLSIYKGFCDNKEIFIISKHNLKDDVDINANYSIITKNLYIIHKFEEIKNEHK